MLADTIFALSSGRLPAAIAVVRISGPRAGHALTALIGRVPEPRKAALAKVRDPQSGEIIDQALALWFPGPNSETGEDTAELQLHGGHAVVAAVFAALAGMAGLRPAEAGEFTRRAFENGHIDLTRVEGLADLIAAETEAQRRQALRQLQGLLGNKAEAWRTRLVDSLALVEAQIDFSDEPDVGGKLLGPALHAAQQLVEEIEETLKGATRGERLREGLVVAIAGPPNVGKSSLLNRLARREAAIVSPLPGTTRDVIEVHLDLAGYPVTLLDTAGLRDSDDPIEQEGVRRARERAAAADLVLWMLDATAGETQGGLSRNLPATQIWIVLNKVDAVQKEIVDNLRKRLSIIDYQIYVISAKAGYGIEALVQGLATFTQSHLGSTEPALVTRARQRQALENTVAALRRAIAEGPSGREDIVAEELHLAARALGRLTGRVDVEDILDVIFRDFCIGK